MQDVLVALIVAACTAYAVWVLMPASLRRALDRRLQRHAWPPFIARALARAASGGNGCCDAGCGDTPAPGQAQPMRFHRKPRP